MNSIWLKIAGIAVVAVIVLVVVGRFKSDKPSSTSATPTESKQSEKPKTFYDMADRDKQFAQAPKPAESQLVEQQPSVATPPAPQPVQPPVQAPAQPAVAGGVVLPSSITQKTTLYFKPLSEEDEIAAEQLLPWAATTRSIGRLPMMSSYVMTVRTCRDILSRWPDSRYAFRAKQILEDISTSSRATSSHITPQEMDISKFLKPRQGAEPVPVEPVQR
jgi:hypothetical protein